MYSSQVAPSSYAAMGVPSKTLAPSMQFGTLGNSIYNSTAVPANANASLAIQAGSNRYMGKDNREYSAATSFVSNVVPTGLFTSYVPAAQLSGYAVQSTISASPNDLAKIHQQRMTGEGEDATDLKATTVYYTDDLFPPYYAKAKKIRTTRRQKPGCCQ